MVRVFFYGLFMDPELLTEQGLNPGNTSIASLPGYQLKIGERASLLESEGACCHGTVIELDNAELQALYRGDGVEDYEPVNVDAVDSNNRSLEAVS